MLEIIREGAFRKNEEIDYSDIANNFFLKYGDTVAVPEFLTSQQINDLKMQKGDFAYVKCEPIDTSIINYTLSEALKGQLNKQNSNDFHLFHR